MELFLQHLDPRLENFFIGSHFFFLSEAEDGEREREMYLRIPQYIEGVVEVL